MITDKVKIMSLNCRGLGDQRKRRDVIHYIRNKNYSIIFLQETHLTAKTIPYFDSLWRGKAYHSCLSSRSRGTSILISSNLQYTAITDIKADCGNYVIVVCKINTESYAFVNIYGPNEDCPPFYRKLNNILEQFNVDYIIVAGDLNFVIDPATDSLNYVGENNINAKQTFLELTGKYNLVDAWRQLHPTECNYTWSRKNPLKRGRLDMFFISDDLLNNVSEVDILPGYRTDHNIITLTIQSKNQRGNGIWKFNTSHLTDENYIKTVKSCIGEIVRQYAVPVYDNKMYNDEKCYKSIHITINDCLFYETLIMMIRGETVRFSKQKAKRLRSVEAKLMAEIIDAENKFTLTGLQSDATELDVIKTKLEELRRPIVDGMIVRSRVAWYEHGEKSSKYFLSLEKTNYNKKCIQYINDGKDIISKADVIIDKFSNILQSKYNSRVSITSDPSFIANHITSRLDISNRTELDEDLTLPELTNALNSMKKGKTPGSNGFPVEFFRCFWPEIGPFLLRAVNASLTEGCELPSHREGIITLIHKKGKSPHTYKGWRPITLLNSDYKIISTAIAIRLKKVMSKLISPAQTAYTSGRFIGENTRLTLDIINWTQNNKKSGMIIAADFDAAFESVDWDYLRLVINEFNFGPKLRKLIDHLFLNTKNQSRILLNGFLGKQIHLERGIRQGDPASGYLFNIAVAILAEQVTKSNQLTGIRINNNQEIRISQYADDTIIFVDGTERSIKGAVKELVTFGNHSGLKINIDKTVGMSIGTLPDQNSTGYNIKFVEQMTVLGIKIDRNGTNVTECNMQLKMPTLKNELEQWKRRNLTPIGRICIIKTLLLSKLVHFFIALPDPSIKYIKELERMFFKFIWGNTNDKIKRTKLVQKQSKDGLNMVDIELFIKSMKLTWLKRLATSHADWTQLAKQQLPEIELLLTYGSGKLQQLRSDLSNRFYIDIIDALIKFNREYKPCYEEIISEKIWYSDWTKYKTTKISLWDERGLRFIGDLYNQNTGKMYCKQEIEDIYGINMTFLCYETLIRSLPKDIRNSIDTTLIYKPNIPYKINLVLNSTNFAKQAYTAFIANYSIRNSCTNKRLQAKWETDISNYKEGSVQKVCAATTSTYLIYLHFRIINRIYATNKYLKTIHIKQSSNCTFCDATTETIYHLFWHCPKTQMFIKEILSHLRIKYKVCMNINSFNWFFLAETSHLEAHVISLGKVCIHIARLTSTQPSIHKMMNLIKLDVQNEYYSARAKNNLEKFEQKWGGLKTMERPALLPNV